MLMEWEVLWEDFEVLRFGGRVLGVLRSPNETKPSKTLS